MVILIVFLELLEIPIFVKTKSLTIKYCICNRSARLFIFWALRKILKDCRNFPPLMKKMKLIFSVPLHRIRDRKDCVRLLRFFEFLRIFSDIFYIYIHIWAYKNTPFFNNNGLFSLCYLCLKNKWIFVLFP